MVIALSATVAFVDAATATVPGGNGRIAFVSPVDQEDFDQNHVYSANPDGSDLVDLMPWFTDEVSGLDWSPDGTMIAFTAYTDQAMAIWIMNADGSNLHKILTIDSFEASISWTPDGERLVYAAAPKGEDDYGVAINSVKVDGTDNRELLVFPAGLADPVVSPDGTRIAFTGDIDDLVEDERARLYVVNIDGTGLHRVTSFYAFLAAWSPDGTRLATVTGRGLETLKVDGSGRTLLLPGIPFLSGLGLSWSPDGARIAYTSYRDGGQTVRILNRDGTCPTRLTNRYVDRVSWQSIPGSAGGGAIQCAHLHINTHANRRLVRAGATYTVHDVIKNTGSAFAQNTRLNHELNDGTRAISVSTSQGSCVLGRTVVCDVGTLTPGYGVRVDIKVKAVRGTPVTMKRRLVRATTTTVDPEPDLAASPLVWACDILGTKGDDVLLGTPASEALCGLNGHDRIEGGGGFDLILGNQGRDVLSGGQGPDWILSGPGNDVIRGGGGDDFLEDGVGNDTIYGEAGRDSLVGSAGRDRLYGGSGNDWLESLDNEPDLLDGGSGRDIGWPDGADRMVSIERIGWNIGRPALLGRSPESTFSSFFAFRLRYDFRYSRWKGMR